MAYPAYIPTRLVSVGGAISMESSELLIIRVSITASKSLVWNDTGYRLQTTGLTAVGEAGSELQIVLPRTDVQGWRDPALNALIDVSEPGSYTHRYTAQISFTTANGVTVGQTVVIGPFPVPDGAGVLDLDTLVPASTTAGDAVSIPDSWSQAVADAEAAALAAEADAAAAAAAAASAAAAAADAEPVLSAVADAQAAAAQAETFAATTVVLQDTAVATLASEPASQTFEAVLTSTPLDGGDALTVPTYTMDYGDAFSVFTSTLTDGGDASSTYTDKSIDGGNAL